MNPTPTSPHAIFDPGSTYNRLRSSFRLEDKFRGYVHWRNYQSSEAKAPGPTILSGPWNNAAEQAPPQRVRAAPKSMVAAPKGRGRKVVVRVDRVDTPLSASVDFLFGKAGDGEPNVGLMLQLANRTDYPREPMACRGFLLDPDLLPQLALNLDSPDADVLRPFHNDQVAHNHEVMRILSAVPELVGTVDANGWGHFRRFSHPEPLFDLPARLNDAILVAVIEHLVESHE